MTSSSAAITSEDSVNSNLITLMVDSGASGLYIDDAIIRELKHRLQDYVHLTTPRKILTARGAMLDGTAECVLQGLVTDDSDNQILVRVNIVVVPEIGHNLFSVMTVAKKRIVTIFDYENLRLEGFTVTVPLWSKSGDLHSFVLDLSADRYGAKELAMNAVANAQVWHQRPDHLHNRAWMFYASETALVSHLRGLSRTVTFESLGKLNSLLTPRQPATRSTGLSSCATGT